MVKITLLVLLFCCSACATMPKEEVVFHVLNAIDAYQTAHLDDKCAVEVAFPTVQILGKDPKNAESFWFFLTFSITYRYLPLRVQQWFTLNKLYYTDSNSQLTTRTGCKG